MDVRGRRADGVRRTRRHNLVSSREASAGLTCGLSARRGRGQASRRAGAGARARARHRLLVRFLGSMMPCPAQRRAIHWGFLGRAIGHRAVRRPWYAGRRTRLGAGLLRVLPDGSALPRPRATAFGRGASRHAKLLHAVIPRLAYKDVGAIGCKAAGTAKHARARASLTQRFDQVTGRCHNLQALVERVGDAQVAIRQAGQVAWHLSFSPRVEKRERQWCKSGGTGMGESAAVDGEHVEEACAGVYPAYPEAGRVCCRPRLAKGARERDELR